MKNICDDKDLFETHCINCNNLSQQTGDSSILQIDGDREQLLKEAFLMSMERRSFHQRKWQQCCPELELHPWVLSTCGTTTIIWREDDLDSNITKYVDVFTDEDPFLYLLPILSCSFLQGFPGSTNEMWNSPYIDVKPFF